MQVGIVGLGLIGGSLAKAAKCADGIRVLGCDIQDTVEKRARLLDAIDDTLTPDSLKQCEIVLLALYPGEAIRFLREHAEDFAPDTLVVDCCGIKGEVCKAGADACAGKKWLFIGGHPMAGVEKSGFAAATRTLFARATMILAPPPGVAIEVLLKLKNFFLSLGFGRIKISTPAQHDRIIAYTSQLAHILSSAYVKSPSALVHAGFSAGSFKDMTRVATLNPDMWTELFLANREPLLEELDGLIERLATYRAALAGQDADMLRNLLAEGRDRKAEVERLEKTAMALLRPKSDETERRKA